MKSSPFVLLACLLGPATFAQEAKPGLFPDGYPDHQALSSALERAAQAHPDRVAIRSLAKTPGGRDVWIATIGKADPHRPAILLVANLEADHVVGSQVALALVERLASSDRPEVKATLELATIYVVPRLNPDGAERVLKGTPRASFRLDLSAVDRDRDGKANEDGPDDLDGDGLATRMRIEDSKGTLVPDEKDARLLRKADAAKGERGRFSESVEGLDNDGDGLINEDPPGGVNLNRNWPQGWAEFDAEAGWSPASQPETRALIAFAFAHPEIAAVWTFALHDSLKDEPKNPGAALDDADLPLVADLSRRYQKAIAEVKAPPAVEAPKEDATRPAESPEARERRLVALRDPAARRMKGKPTVSATPPPVSLDGTTDGSMGSWAYQQFGVIGVSSRLWSSPELPEPAKDKPANPGDGDLRWLAWNDRVMGGRAFVPFAKFDHPELGPVEIGGWKPGVRVNPPIERAAVLADSHLAFLLDMTKTMPRLEIRDAKVEAKGGGIFRVTATVANLGTLPTALAQGVKTRTAPPVVVRFLAPGAKLLAGKVLDKVDTLAGSGGKKEYSWMVLAPEGARAATISASCAKAGRVEKPVELK